MKALLALTAIAFVAVPAVAGTLVYDGDTTGGPTWNRPWEDFSQLSLNGTDVPYEVIQIEVDLDGDYDFLMTQTDVFDTFLLLYGPVFDPNDGLSNGVAGDDDFGSLTQSGFTTGLTAGTPYFVVATGFANDDFGAYNLTVNGPGNITPEPTSLLLLGLAGVLIRRR